MLHLSKRTNFKEMSNLYISISQKTDDNKFQFCSTMEILLKQALIETEKS